ncbi:hypothetical protein WJX73_003776 [Symbiochloris irregularis]|uniref:Uncharacterized protein n=1 Tax=Symbiochloris irregularis TaxID=706552 RepID=A0AAW1PU71_9CHLO
MPADIGRDWESGNKEARSPQQEANRSAAAEQRTEQVPEPTLPYSTSVIRAPAGTRETNINRETGTSTTTTAAYADTKARTAAIKPVRLFCWCGQWIKWRLGQVHCGRDSSGHAGGPQNSRFKELWTTRGRGSDRFCSWLLRFLDSHSVEIRGPATAARVIILQDLPRHYDSSTDSEIDSYQDSRGEVVAAAIRDIMRSSQAARWQGEQLRDLAVIDFAQLGVRLREQAREPYSPFSN